jgi:hypothetical protein
MKPIVATSDALAQPAPAHLSQSRPFRSPLLVIPHPPSRPPHLIEQHFLWHAAPRGEARFQPDDQRAQILARIELDPEQAPPPRNEV